MDLTVRINGVSLFGRMPPTGEGFVIAPDGFEGWDDAVSIKGDSVSHPQAHGDFDVPGFLDSRVVSVSGSCIADSAQRTAWFGAQLTGLLAEGSGQVVVDHMGQTLWGIARLAPGAQTKFKVSGADPTTAKFQIQLKFPNPRKFGQARTFAGGTPAHHYGNFPAAPVHTITGWAAGGYTITGPSGKLFVVTEQLVANVPHTVDMSTGRLSIGGAVIMGGISRGDTWAIPGGARVSQTISGGLAVLSTKVRDTFV